MNFLMVLAYLQSVEETLEWTTSDGRTFQIAGDKRFAGYYERFFHAGSHPTRRNMTEKEAEKAFGSGSATGKFGLYSGLADEVGQDITREQLYDKIEELFPGSKRGQ